MTGRAAERLVETLERHAVDRVFCVPGESYIAVLDALHDSAAVQVVTCRHEGGAGLMAVADAKTSLILSGTGDVLEPEDSLIGIGSGGVYALAAAKALLSSDLSAEDIAKRAMEIAAGICVYTNDNVLIESLAAK